MGNFSRLKMQKQLYIKFLSKIPRNASCTNSTNLISPKSIFSSSFLKTHGNPLYQQSFSQHSTLSHSQLWKLYSPSRVSGRMRYGVSPSPVLARRFLLKWQSNYPVKGAIKRRYFHSFDSQYRDWRSIFRALKPDGVVIGLIVANVAVFMLWRVAGSQFMMNNFMISVDNFTSGRLHTLVTSAFSHRDMSHLINNMVGLYFFGTSIGRTFGPKYLLKLYLCGAVVGSIFNLAYRGFSAVSLQSSNQTFGVDPKKIRALGASGAVNAIMLLDMFLFPLNIIFLDFFIPVPAILVGIYVIREDVLRILEGDQKVSGAAHLGGATVAVLAWARSRRGRFRQF